MALIDWVKELSFLKLFLLFIGLLIFCDMFFYYVGAFMGKPAEPYPILYEIFTLLKEVRITPAMTQPGAGG